MDVIILFEKYFLFLKYKGKKNLAFGIIYEIMFKQNYNIDIMILIYF